MKYVMHYNYRFKKKRTKEQKQNMGRFTKYNGKIMLPIQIAKVKFYEKEDTSLNSFQNFLLEAIEQGSSIPQIVEATLLTQNVIATEIMQMVSQRLLIKEDGSILLSDLSKKILMVSRCVKKLNGEHKKVCINLINGEMEEYDTKKIQGTKDESAVYLTPKISEGDIDGISIEENISFFSSYMDTFHEYDEKQIESVLESVYVEFDISDKEKGYESYSIAFLPCVLEEDELDEMPDSENDDMIKAKGLIYKISYSVKSKMVELNENIIPSLIQIGRMDAKLLSEKGMDVIEKYNEFKEFEQKDLVCYLDSVSCAYGFQRPDLLNKKRMKTNMELPVLHTMTSGLKDFLLERLKEYFCIPDDLIICEADCLSEEYIVECSLGNLWSRNDD